MKRVIIHGAINGSNFGDILFAHIFYRATSKLPNTQVRFFESSVLKGGCGAFLRKDLDYYKKLSFKEFLQADTLILMSGGYFGDDQKSLRQTIKRWYRYFLPARIMQILGKKTYVLGVGGGPIHSVILRKIAVNVLNRSEYISFRDEETNSYFIANGMVKEATVNSDTAQILVPEHVNISENIKNLRTSVRKEKILLVHLLPSEARDKLISETLIPGINAFLKNHREYGVICSFDGLSGSISPEETLSFKNIESDNKVSYCYNSSAEMCELIGSVDFIVTCKLHVGIVGASLEKSVVAFPFHREKVERYYKQIGESNRCTHMSKIKTEQVLPILEEYHNRKIFLPAEIREAAWGNLSIIETISK